MKPIYEHFHPDERPFVDRALEWVERASAYHERKLTDFLDPRQASIVDSLVRRDGNVRAHLFGGYPAAERLRALIVPDYAEPGDSDVPIVVLAIESQEAKAAELDHGDYLGGLLGLGIKREKIGDLHVRPDGCHALVAGEMADFLDLHLRSVGRVGVRTDVLPLSQLRPVIPNLERIQLSVASLRLDGIVSDVIRVSRAKVLAPIKAGRCRVNWRPEEDPSTLLKEGDVVSMQGFGRFKVLEVAGQTKTGRIRLTIGKFV